MTAGTGTGTGDGALLDVLRGAGVCAHAVKAMEDDAVTLDDCLERAGNRVALLRWLKEERTVPLLPDRQAIANALCAERRARTPAPPPAAEESDAQRRARLAEAHKDLEVGIKVKIPNGREGLITSLDADGTISVTPWGEGVPVKQLTRNQLRFT